MADEKESRLCRQVYYRYEEKVLEDMCKRDVLLQAGAEQAPALYTGFYGRGMQDPECRGMSRQ